MKKYTTILFVFFIFLFSCQDTVNVNLETGKERLVIEALLKWEKGTQGNEQIIKLSKTSSFYNNQIIPVTGASVVVTKENYLVDFVFSETEDGIYTTESFEPEYNATYKLQITYNGEIYEATETLFKAPEILAINQSTEEGFSTDAPEVNVVFQDFEGQPDYYHTAFKYYKPNNGNIDDLTLKDNFNFIFNDTFQADNPISIFYENEDLVANDVVIIELEAISKQFYNFLEKIEEQTNAGFGPFSLPPINLKGNIKNTTNKDNYPYGFFSVNEVDKEEYIFQ